MLVPGFNAEPHNNPYKQISGSIQQISKTVENINTLVQAHRDVMHRRLFGSYALLTPCNSEQPKRPRFHFEKKKTLTWNVMLTLDAVFPSKSVTESPRSLVYT